MGPTGAADYTIGAVAGAKADCTTGVAAAVCISASTGDRVVAASGIVTIT